MNGALPGGSSTNLPLQLTSFVGRERERASIRAHLAQSHLVTLTGVGGGGKTRLALQVAEDCLADFPGGVWWTEMAALDDGSLVPQAVANALSLRGEFGRDLTAAIIDTLRDSRALLIFDNCEHVAAACAHFAEDILRACRNVTILATSRELLNIPGETPISVPSLSVPDIVYPQTGVGRAHLSQIADCEAVRLFVERASVADAEFRLSEANAPVVAHICQRLDGIPLAIELAAVRVKILSVSQIAARLDDRFRLLVGGSRTALHRYRTMRAALDWSHDLLSPEERVLFRRLSVFSRGFTLDAAEAVAADLYTDDVIHREDVLDLLSHLVDKSLLERHERGAGPEARYRMLETVREYAREKLIEAVETETAHRRHLRWHVALAQQAAVGIRGPRQTEWLDRLELEHENLRGALAWAQADPDVTEDGLRLAASLFWFWYLRSYITEGRNWLEARLERGPYCEWREPLLHGDPDVPLLEPEVVELHRARADALLGAGVLAAFQDDYPKAQRYFHECIAIYESLQDESGLAYAWMFAGLEADFEADYERAQALQPKSVAMFRKVGDTWGLAWALNFLAMSSLVSGDYATIRAQLEESLALFHATGDPAGPAMPLGVLGMLDQRQGNYARARERLEGALAIYRASSDTWHTAFVLNNLGLTALRQTQFDLARHWLLEAVALYRPLGDKGGLAASLSDLGDVYLTLGDEAEAERLYRESLALWQSLNIPGGMAWLTHNLGYIAMLRGDADAAGAAFQTSEAPLRQVHDDYNLASVLVSQAGISNARQDWAQTYRLIAESLAIRVRLGDRRGMSDAVTMLAISARDQGKYALAALLLGVSKAARDAMGAPLAPRYVPYHNGLLSDARAALGEARFNAAWSAGLALPLEKAVEALLQGGLDAIALPTPDPVIVDVRPVRKPPPPTDPPLEAVRIYGLGPTQICRDSYQVQPSDYGDTRAPEMLFYLLSQPNRSLHSIGVAIWPDASAQQMRDRFHNTLHNLRKALGHRNRITRARDQYEFNRELPYWYDVEAFEFEVALGQRLAPSAPSEAIPHLQAAIELYRGPFLKDVDTAWATQTRQALDMAYLRALLTLARLHFDAGQYRAAARVYRQVIEHDEYEEAAHRGLMLCYARQGERGQAIRHYQALFKSRTEEAMPLDPETIALFERLRAGEE